MVSQDEGSAGVTITPAVLRWVGGGWPGSMVSFEPSETVEVEALISVVEQAMAEVNPPAGTPTPIHASGVIEGTDVVYLWLANNYAETAEVRQFLTQLAEALGRAGLTGSLRRPLPQYPDDDRVTKQTLYAPQVSVFCAHRRRGEADVVTRLAQAVELRSFPSHDLYDGGDRVAVRCRARLPFLFPGPTITSVRGWGEGSRVASIAAGESRTSCSLVTGDLLAEAERARRSLREVAPHVQQAFATVTKGAGSWVRLVDPRSDRLAPGNLLARPELVSSRVHDAHGLQVLTADHLARASSLTDWEVEQIGDRYLVQARDLTPWYAGLEPEPTVREQARADFGDMIMTQSEFDALREAERQEKIREYQQRVARGETT